MRSDHVIYVTWRGHHTNFFSLTLRRMHPSNSLPNSSLFSGARLFRHIGLWKAPHIGLTLDTLASTIYGAPYVNPLTVWFHEGFIWWGSSYQLLRLLPRKWGAILAPIAKIYVLTFLAKGRKFGTIPRTWSTLFFFFFSILYHHWPKTAAKTLKLGHDWRIYAHWSLATLRVKHREAGATRKNQCAPLDYGHI